MFHTVAEGNGPVNALDAAIRKALLNYFPDLEEVQLSDYKVRVIDGDAATASRCTGFHRIDRWPWDMEYGR